MSAVVISLVVLVSSPTENPAAVAPSLKVAANRSVLAQRRPAVRVPRGGRAGAVPGRAAAGRQSTDQGEQLADLIQDTVRPPTWARNGGSGTIYYWRPGRTMVVRQSSEVHQEIGSVLRQLERAGR